MTKLHIVRKALKQGDRWYVYAWRGGPCIHSCDTKPVVTHAILAKQQTEMANRFGRPRESFDTIIDAYRASPEFARVAESTKVEYRRWLNRISERFGRTPISVFEDMKMRGDIITWRNLWAEQPRTADAAAVMMSTLLSWAVENAKLTINVAAKIKQLHKVNRADLIWEQRHWDTWASAEVPKHIQDAVTLAHYSGLRLGDLVKVTWEEVGPTAIIRFTNKGAGKKVRAVIPIIPELRDWMNKTPVEKRTGTLLKNSRGFGWTASGFESSYQKKKPRNFERTIHDLRGTFCTRIILAGLTDEEAAKVMGWSSKRVAEIRARYVDEARIILSIADKLSKRQEGRLSA